MLAKFDENPELQSQCHKLLNTYENFARGVRQEVYDEVILRSARKTAVQRTYTAFVDYVEHRRRDNNPLAYLELEKLIHKWNESNRVHEVKKQNGQVKINVSKLKLATGKRRWI